MATLVLGAVGTAIGGAFGGAILGFSGAAIGGFIGSTVGSVVDSWIVSSLAPAQRIEGARLDTLRITSATEGAVIPRLYGRMRIGGNIIWATDFREETKTTTQGGGKGGGGSKVKTTEYLYYASFAVALCEGPITGIGRVWADGKAMDMTGVTWRWYPGNEVQAADPFIAAKMGAANTPAYRGTAYVVFEDLALTTFGNRLPQLSFEVFRPLADADTAEGLTRAVTLIPASGEFTYATDAIRKGSGGATVAENLNALPDQPDIVVALDRLQAMAPAVESVSLVVAWFGNDLRAGSCKVKPGVEVASKATTPANWSVNGVSRASAHLVSRDAEDRPVYGGTPADFAVVQAIQEMKARGLRVTFYPFLLMDVPPGNTLPNPYSANAATPGQPAFPWRGRITCSPAAGFVGSVDKTGTAATQVSALFGAATPGNFSVSGESVSFTGSPYDWGLRRMVLHYAHLCAAAGGVDAFLIGTEMPGLTTIRSGASTYPAVTAFRTLAADVSSILGAGTKIGYAADWSEYFGHHPQDGSGDVYSTSTRCGRMPTSTSSASTTTCLCPIGVTASTMPMPLKVGLRSTTVPICRRTSPGAKASTGSTPTPPTAPRKSARPLPMVQRVNRGSSAPRTSAPGGRTRTTTDRAGWRAAWPPHGCRNRNPSVSPNWAAPPSTGAPTSRTSSSTRSRPRASCRISRAAGGMTRSSALIWKPATCIGATRQTTRTLPSMAAVWCMCRNAPPGPGTRGPIRSFRN